MLWGVASNGRLLTAAAVLADLQATWDKPAPHLRLDCALRRADDSRRFRDGQRRRRRPGANCQVRVDRGLGHMREQREEEPKPICVRRAVGTDRWRQRSASAWRAWLQAPAWRPLRWGLLALVLVQFVGIQAWSWRQSALSKNQQETLKSILRSTFPQVTVVIDPLAQMQREVKALGQASGIGLPGDLGVMLSALADVGAMSPRRLEYAGGQLQLSPWPLEPSEAAQVQAALALRGYQLEGAGEQWQMRVKSP